MSSLRQRQQLPVRQVGTWGDVNAVSVFLQSSDLLLELALHRVEQQQLLTLAGRDGLQWGMLHNESSLKSKAKQKTPPGAAGAVVRSRKRRTLTERCCKKMCCCYMQRTAIDLKISPLQRVLPPSAGRRPGSHIHICSSPTPGTAPCRSLWRAEHHFEWLCFTL